MTDNAREPLSARQFVALFPRLDKLKQAAFLPALNRAMQEFAITTPLRAAAFVAQLGHESLSLERWEESFAYTPDRLLAVFPNAIQDLTHAREVCAAGPKVIAEAIYGRDTNAGARLGNTRPGDGWAFRGQGPHQLSGRDNYQRHADVLALPLLEQPELLQEPRPGFRSAALFWLSKQMDEFADRDSLDGYRMITKRWNGGLNGWEDRLKRYREARAVLGLPKLAEVA